MWQGSRVGDHRHAEGGRPDLVRVVRAKDAADLAMARQVSAAGTSNLQEQLEIQRRQLEEEQLKYIRSMKVTIDGADLIVLREALRSAGRAYRRIYDSILNGL